MPQNLSINDVVEYVEKNIKSFHDARLNSLSRLTIDKVLERKNPYLYKAKNVLTAQEFVQNILDAHLSSQEEAIFGTFLEGLAVFVADKVYGGKKSSAEGIDLEFEKEGILHIVSIKSGPNWGNSSQIKKMKDSFSKAKRTLQTNAPQRHIIAVNGCCYGTNSNPNQGEYFKYCGQQFWGLISGNDRLYIDIIEPLGHKAKERNEEFQTAYAKVLNTFTNEFFQKYCTNGLINWQAIVTLNSGIKEKKPRARAKKRTKKT